MSYEHFLDPALYQSVQKAITHYAQLQLSPKELPLERICQDAFTFLHTPEPPRPFQIMASDGSGSFPLLQRDDVSFYLVTADGLSYRAQPGLNPLPRYGKLEQISEVIVWADHWSRKAKIQALDDYYHLLTGKGFRQLAQDSDYLALKQQYAQRPVPTQAKNLRPLIYSSAETDAMRKLLMGSAELAVALKTVTWDNPPEILLLDGTLSLPSLTQSQTILTNVLKRHLVTVARDRGISAIALSKSSTFVGATEITQQLTDHFQDTHWAYRFPLPEEEPLGIEGLTLPPAGAVTYLVRFHRDVPGLRLDFDRQQWEQMGKDDWVKSLLPLLDFTSHEARSYGYPHPLFAAHVHCSLTNQARKTAKSLLLAKLRDAGFDSTEFEEIHATLGMGEW